jgi:hypothetical protein
MKRLFYYLQRIRTYYQRQGLRGTLKYLLKNGPHKRVINRYHYFIKQDRYSQNIVFIAGLAKGGSTWLYHLFASLDGFASFAPARWTTAAGRSYTIHDWDLYPDLFREFRHHLAVIRGHTLATAENLELIREHRLKVIVSMRDPRDAAISGYWYFRRSRFHRHYEAMQDMSLEDYITFMLDSGRFNEMILSWMRSWLDVRDEGWIHPIRYEDLLQDTSGGLATALEFLAFPTSMEEVERIVEKNRFERIAGRKRGVEDVTGFLRKGVAGEWKEVFSPEQKKRFAEVGEDVIQRLGYEPTLE